MKTYQRIFGSGPLGTVISLGLLFVAVLLEDVLGEMQITGSDAVRYIVFVLASVLTLLVIVWSVRSLPPAERGHNLVTTGAFTHFRHPLYGAFLSCFNFGLAIFLNNWVYVLWAFLLHPVWHWVVRGEEALMERAFPDVYREYAARTGRFFPRLWDS